MSSVMENDKLSWMNLMENHSNFELLVDNNIKRSILVDIGNNINQDGFVVDSLGNTVKSKDEGEIKLKDLGVVATGSKIFIRKNIASFNEYLIEKKD